MAVGNDWTTDNAATMQYDGYKVQAILNEIDGFDHSGTHHVGTPAIFGMNFQTISTAQKLPTSDGLTGGYLAGGLIPGPLLTRALNWLDGEIGRMVAEIKKDGLAGSTAIIISAKHGQSPTDPNALTRVPDGPIISAINAAWAATHPSNKSLVDLLDRRRRHAAVAERPLAAGRQLREEVPAHPHGARQQHQRQPDHRHQVRPQEGLRGRGGGRLHRGPWSDPRVPDVIGISQYGTVYTGGMKKIAEHGGDASQDRNVPILLVLPGHHDGRVIDDPSRRRRSPRQS